VAPPEASASIETSFTNARSFPSGLLKNQPRPDLRRQSTGRSERLNGTTEVMPFRKLSDEDSERAYTIPRRNSSMGYFVPRHTIPPCLMVNTIDRATAYITRQVLTGCRKK
jgi:hypothetical protein